ncbi:hypothetical protein LEP3755_16440 [Leptolyngbya sp. NIES-3755]|nr:hypothetical protein LEP3755_16440 [Leptolyngbya sp. NIES-3755]
MNDELTSFLIGVGLLILYLIFSAFTEMGTKNPRKKNDAEKE